MSMDVYLRILLFCLFTTQTWAGPLSTASPALLTPFLANNVPICAQPCLQSFVADSFPSSVCSSPSINCLCTSDSETGYTIGEGALSCLASGCRDWDQDEAISAYDVCSNVEGSMPNTHTVLTASHTIHTTLSDTSSTSIPASSTSLRSDSTSTASQRSTISSSSPTSTSTSSLTDPISTVKSSVPSSSTQTPASSVGALPASEPPSPSPSSSPVLTKPQIAGVVVASIGAAALAFGLCFLLFCCRRKKHVRRHSGSSFGGDKVVGAGSTTDSTPDLAILAARDFGHDPEGKEVVSQPRAQSPPQLTVMTPGSTGEGGWSQWRRNTAPQDIGLALAPGILTPAHPSPNTPTSHRTRNSQLLPDKPSSDKPSYSLFPPPLRPSPHSRRVSQSLEAQLAARNVSATRPTSPQMTSPRFPGTLDTSQTTMQGESNSRTSLPRPNVFPAMQAARGESGYKPYRQEQPSNVTSKPLWSEQINAFARKPVPAYDSPSARGIRLGRSIHNRHPEALRDRFNGPSTVLTPLDTTSLNTPRRNPSDSRPATYLSTGTETSFEDAEDDVPDPVSALTPTKQYDIPTIVNPFATSSRSNPRPHLPARADSLLARRRGEQQASQAKENITPLSVPRIARHSAKQQILQSPVLSEPLATESSSSNSNSPMSNGGIGMRPPSRMNRGAGMTPPPSGWPGRR